MWVCVAKLRGRDLATGLDRLIAAKQLVVIWAEDRGHNAHTETKTCAHSISTCCIEFKNIKLQSVLSKAPLAEIMLTVPTAVLPGKWWASLLQFIITRSPLSSIRTAITAKDLSLHFLPRTAHSPGHLVAIYYQDVYSKLFLPPSFSFFHFFISSSLLAPSTFWSVLWYFIVFCLFHRDCFHLPVCLASYHF